MFKIKELTKSYGNRLILDIEALSVAENELLAIVGPSGAGKSTLLRLLHFLEIPTSGKIAFKGQPVKYPVELEQRRSIAMVFQRPEMLDDTVRVNVGIGMRFRGVTDLDLVDRAIRQVGLGDRADASVRTLSGGELQRVALARVLVLSPKVLLLDEPTANLDPRNVRLIEKIIHDLRANSGTTIVLVTHNIFQARRLGDRVALVIGGKLVEVNQVEQFFLNPVDERARAFVRGEMIY